MCRGNPIFQTSFLLFTEILVDFPDGPRLTEVSKQVSGGKTHFLTFKLFKLFISLQSKEINRIKVLRGQSWGAGKWGTVSKIPSVFFVPHRLQCPVGSNLAIAGFHGILPSSHQSKPDEQE